MLIRVLINLSFVTANVVILAVGEPPHPWLHGLAGAVCGFALGIDAALLVVKRGMADENS